MVKVIQDHEEDGIHRWDLIDEAKISIRDYNMLKSYLQHKFDDTVKYEKTTQMWNPIKVPIKPGTLIQTSLVIKEKTVL